MRRITRASKVTSSNGSAFVVLIVISIIVAVLSLLTRGIRHHCVYPQLITRDPRETLSFFI
jgi:hypothetical protein